MPLEHDCKFHDRDGKVYPAAIEHLTNPADYTDGPRVYCVPEHDQYGKPVLTQVLFRESGQDGATFHLAADPDSAATRWQTGRGGIDTDKLDPRGGHWYRCLLIRPQAGFNEVGSQPAATEASLPKIPIVDLSVDFSSPHGKPRVNHVGNVRHIGDVASGPGMSRIPHYVPNVPIPPILPIDSPKSAPATKSTKTDPK